MMLTHGSLQPAKPRRVVVLGAAGFVGGALVRWLIKNQIPALPLSRTDIDLTHIDSARKLEEILHHDDSLVVISARAPVKSNEMLIDNLRMMASVCLAIKNRPPGQVIYVSSDAVYADSDAPLSESSCAEPSSLHGVMHLARELMLKEVFNDSLCVVRPTLIYGPDDPHNGYGPNRFRRLANAGQDITLFGDGEERRDHVYIDDVAELIGRCSLHSSRGILNIACGTVFSFRDIAEIVVALSSQRVVINSSPRIGSMPHRGFRPFDPSLTHLMFPDFAYTQLPAGLGLCQQHHDEN